MKRYLYALAFLALVAVPPAAAEVTVEIASESGGAVETTATEKSFYLVLPQRFFRPRGEAGFSVPYIAELYFTTDGGATWESAGLFKELDKPFEFTAQAEGRYGFFVTLVDQKGNSDITPASGTEPQLTVLVDWTVPKVALVAPAGGTLVGSGAPLEIKWTAEDLFLPDEPITIDCSSDSGATWTKIAGPIENTSSFPWKPASDFIGRVLIRVTAADEAGHTASAETTSPLLVDTAAPQAAVTGPTLSASDKVTLEVASSDGDGSGVAQMNLFVSHDGGLTWVPSGTTPPGAPLLFTAPDGAYSLFVSAADRAGNESAAPAPGDAPQITLTIDTKKPLVSLQTLKMGASVAGGTTIPLQWEAVSPNPAPLPISIYLSPDAGNSWETVGADLPNNGHFLWEVPPINSSRCKLKITMRDSSGATGEAQSAKLFTIDSSRPTSAIGVAPSKLGGEVGDLSSVLRPLGKPQTAPPAPAAEAAPSPAPEEAPAPAATSAAPAVTEPEATPAPDAPWSEPQEEPYAQPPGPDATFEELMKAGLAAYNGGLYNIATDYFQRAAVIEAEDARPHAALGRTYAKQAGFNYTSKKESFEAAVYEFEKALSLGGDDPDVLNDLGCIFLQTNRLADAEKALARAVETGSKAVYRLNLGIALKREGRNKEAIESFKGAVELDPAMKEAHFFLGRLYAATGDWADARVHWEKAVEGYGPQSRLGKVALAGLQKTREALGEVAPESREKTLQEKLDRIR